jgi:hypothetical protein
MKINKFYGVVFLALLLTSLWSASGTFDSWDANVRLRVTHQIVTEGRLVSASKGNDTYSSTFRDRQGTYTSHFGLGQSIFFLPFDGLATFFTSYLPLNAEQLERARLFFVSVPVFWTVLSLNFLLSLRLSTQLGVDRLTAYLISFVGTFGSSFWEMAKTGQEEVQLSILLLGSLSSFFYWREKGASRYIWLSAILAAITVIFRVTSGPIFVAIAGLYAYEALQQKRASRKQLFLKTLIPFAAVVFFGIVVIGSFNYLKTGHFLRTGYALNGWFVYDLMAGLVQPVFGLDKSIILTNLWIVPCLALTVLVWRDLTYELKLLGVLSLFLFCISVATYAKCCWAGGPHYSARYQVHLVPLLCLSLGIPALTYLRTHAFKHLALLKQKVYYLFIGILLLALQLPAISFHFFLEPLQAHVSNIQPLNESPTGRIGHVRLRYLNFANKLMTGRPVIVGQPSVSDNTLKHVAKVSRWNFWPWAVQQHVGATVFVLIVLLWLAILLGSLVSWGYIFWKLTF